MELLGDPYVIMKVKGKGLGMVACKDIHPGDLVVEEEPLLMVPLDPDGDLWGHMDQDNQEFVSPSLVRSLSTLTDDQLVHFYNLSDSCTSNTSISTSSAIRGRGRGQGVEGDDHSPVGRPEPAAQSVCLPVPKVRRKTNYGILKTNSFSVELDPKGHEDDDDDGGHKDSGNGLAVFVTVSRINHSCRPNCNHYWADRNSRRFMVRAVRFIPSGEEITISYMSPMQRRGFDARASRQRILADEFGFRCLCEICDPSFCHLADDRRRVRVLEIEHLWRRRQQRRRTSGPKVDEDPEGAPPSSSSSPPAGSADPAVAFSLAKEEFKLCRKLRFHSGLMTLAALRCVEAAAFMLLDQHPDASPKVDDDDEKENANVGTSRHTKATVLDFGQVMAETALQHSKVAYGDGSAEAKAFETISRIWNRPPPCGSCGAEGTGHENKDDSHEDDDDDPVRDPPDRDQDVKVDEVTDDLYDYSQLQRLVQEEIMKLRNSC